MKTLHNRVIFLPDYGTEDYTIGDFVLKVDASYEPGKHQPITGTIVAHPEELIFDDTQEWDVPMEVQLGDKVIVDFSTLYNAIEDGHTTKILGKECVFLPYCALLCAKRVDTIIPLNGYVIGAALSPQDVSEFENLHKRKFQHDIRLSKIMHVGARVNQYYYTKDHDDFDPKVGSVVVLDNYCDLPIENEGRLLFFDQKMFYFHRKNILGVI